MHQNVKSFLGSIATITLSIFSEQGRSIIIFLLTTATGIATLAYTCLNIYFKFIKPNIKRSKKHDHEKLENNP